MVNFDAVQRQPWVVGNWKMHGSLSENERLLSDLVAAIEAHPSGVPMARCAVAVPSPYLFQAAVRLKGHPVGWGAQDVSAEPMGAFTGEVSVGMRSVAPVGVSPTRLWRPRPRRWRRQD